MKLVNQKMVELRKHDTKLGTQWMVPFATHSKLHTMLNICIEVN